MGHPLGWSVFERKTGTRQVVPNRQRTPIPQFHFEMLLFNVAQGSTVNMFGVRDSGDCLIWFFKAKNEDTVKVFKAFDK